MVKKCFSPDLARSAGLADNRFPITNDEACRAEEILAKELDKLTLDEHEKILFDVHGIARTEDEDPETMAASFKSIREEIAKIEDNNEAYQLALAKRKEYVDNDKFLGLFLRAEQLDIKAAAEMVVTHFDVKRKLFGSGEVLARDVRLSDLDREDIDFLQSGFIQILPTRDAAGRIVMVMSPPFKAKCTKALVSPVTRVTWYLHMETLKAENAQTKGIVIVLYNFCNFKEDVDCMKEVHSIRGALPLRVDAAHYCYNDPSLRPFVTGIRLFIDPHARFRLRPHFGTPLEIEFELQTFGIPTHDSPMQKDGSWSTEWHIQWIAAQRTREKKEAAEESNSSGQPPSKSVIAIPRRFDVLFGKSKKVRAHTGNLRAMHLCDMNRSKYEAASKYGKTEVAERIVAVIQQSHGRFLKDEKGIWIEVDESVAREKISHFFRHMRSKTRIEPPSPSQEPLTNDFQDEAAKQSTSTKRVTPCPSPDLLVPSQRI